MSNRTDACLLAILFWFFLIGCVFIFLPTIAHAETMYVTVSEGSCLNGRSEPSKDSSIEYHFQNGDTVNVLEIVDGWAKVDEGGEMNFSYVSIDYLSTNEQATEMTVNANGRVRVRATPDGEIIGYVRDGDNVTVSLFYGDWAKIESGWVKSAYLEERA